MTIRKFRSVLMPAIFAFAEDETHLPSVAGGWRVEAPATIPVGMYDEMMRAVTHLGYFLAPERYAP